MDPKKSRDQRDQTEIEFLPDADAIERSPLPRYVRLTLHVMAFALFSFILWASFSKVEKVVVAHGRLVNPQPNIVVSPLDTAIVKTITVRAGQVVKKGEVLATLDPTFTQADETQLRNRLRSLDTQTESLRAELSGKPVDSRGGDADQQLQAQLATERQANYEAQKLRMQQNVARLKAALETNQRDQQVLAQRHKSLAEIEAMQERLVAENFGAKMQLLEARDRRLEVERSMVMGRNKDAEMQRELAGAEAELSAFTRNWRQRAMEDLLAATRDRDGINEQLAKADLRNKLVQLTAPADAVVLEIGKGASPGAVARGTETLFTLVPLNARLQAEVQVDSLDIGSIKTGDVAHVKLDAFPYQKYGMLDGKVTNISEDSFKRDQVRPGEGTNAYYLATIEWSPDSKLRKMEGGARLLPGMTVSGEIVVGKRSVMSYLLWPLTKALDESLREP